MRKFLLSLLTLALSAIAPAQSAEPFEIKDGDRVLFLGDTLLEREGTYGYLETRMAEQFPDRKFTVRNLAFSADTPLGWSRASFDPAAKGFERLKEQLALVKPTVVFLGYGMAASLQEMTDRSQDWTLNRDPARYGAEPMSAGRFKKELAQCMDAIVKISRPAASGGASNGESRASGRAGFQPAVPGILPGTPNGERPAQRDTPSGNGRTTTPGTPGKIPGAAGGTPTLPEANAVRFVLLSPIRHEDLRATRPGLPDPTEHNKLLEQYTKAIEELAKARGARLVYSRGFEGLSPEDRKLNDEFQKNLEKELKKDPSLAKTLTTIFGYTENGIHPSELGWSSIVGSIGDKLGWEHTSPSARWASETPEQFSEYSKTHLSEKQRAALRAAIIRKNELFFHRWRPANETYLFGFRKREQGQNAAEIPKFDPLIEAAEAEIERLKKGGSAQSTQPAANPAPVTSHQSPVTAAEHPALPAPQSTLPLPTFTLADGLEISLWAENPLLAKPTQCNWDAQGRLWVASSAMYPQIAPGQEAFDKIIILEDPGHTGKATKATVFADGLLIPTGVAPVLTPEGRWACYVGQSTELLYFEDTDGDGKADKKRIVLSGFGTEDTHHIIHTLRWGPDGRLYFNQSVYIHTHMETPWGVVRLNSGGVFAYDPRTERVEVFARGLWNTWGHAWDKWGQSFLTDGAGRDGISWAFPGAIFAPFEGSRRQTQSISPGNYPKFCGLEILYSPHFPADWQGSAVTCDFRAHKIVHFRINDLGSNAETQRRGEEGNSAVPPAAVTPGAAIPPSSSASSLRLSVSALKSGYTTEQLPVLVQTSDATFRPIDVKLGPDGALYIADWSNPIINHGEVDFRDPRRDHEHGRIWRLSMKGGAAVKWESLVGKKVGELFSKACAWRWNETPPLKLPGGAKSEPAPAASLWEVESARQTLLAMPDNEIVAELQAVQRTGMGSDPAIQSTTSEVMLALARVTPAADPTQEIPPSHSDAFVAGIEYVNVMSPSRGAHLVRSMASLWKQALAGVNPKAHEEWTGHALITLGAYVHSKTPRVRLESMRALATFPSVKSASLILDAAIHAPKDDPQYEFAAWLSINDLAEVWTKAVLAGEWKPEGREKQFEFALNAIEPALAGQVLSQFVSTGRAPLDGSGAWIELIGKAGDKAALQKLFERVAESGFDHERPKGQMPRAKDRFDEAAGVRALNALAEAARLRNLRPGGPLAHAAVLIHSDYMDIRKAAARLAGLWKLPEAAPLLEALAKQVDATQRAAAFEGLSSLGGEPAIAALQKLVRSDFSPVPPAALAALAQLKPGAAIAEIPAVLGAIKSEPELLATWRGIFQAKGAVDQLSANFPANLPKPIVTAALRAARELGRPGQRLVAKLTPLAGETAASAAPADYNDLATRAKNDGDPVAGEAMYRRMASACTTCHAIGGAGGKLGPDMTSIGASAPADYIIESILNPASKVKEGYHAFSFAMKDGTEAIGIPSRETPQEQFIRTIAGEQGLPKANIVTKKITEGGASLMPAGLVNSWTDRERLNLYAFLMELGRPGPFDASKNNVARVWMLADVAKVDGALKVEAAASTSSIPSTPSNYAYTLVDGRLTKDLLAERLAMLAPKNATVHLTARFQAASAGKAKLNLTGIRKAWLDGQPLAIASEPSPTVDLTAGEHTFTVEVDAKSLPEVLRLESPAASFLGD